MDKKRQIKVMVITLVSWLLFCSLIVVVSLSPLSELGEGANHFNSVGMWTSFGISTLGYLIPLAFFLLGVKYFKTIMTIFCSMGLLSGLTMIGTIIVLCSFVSNISYDSTIIGSLISSGLLCVVNLVWFIVVFSPGSKNAIKGS